MYVNELRDYVDDMAWWPIVYFHSSLMPICINSYNSLRFCWLIVMASQITGNCFVCPTACYPPPSRFNEVERGVYWFHLVHLSVCGQNRVRSVSSTILVGSISYLHILSRKSEGVACNVFFFFFFFFSKFDNFKFWQILEICNFDIVFIWLGIQYDSTEWVIMRRRG